MDSSQPSYVLSRCLMSARVCGLGRGGECEEIRGQSVVSGRDVISSDGDNSERVPSD